MQMVSCRGFKKKTGKLKRQVETKTSKIHQSKSLHE